MAESGDGQFRSQGAYAEGASAQWSRDAWSTGQNPAVRGGHPEQREAGGGWGADGSGRGFEQGDSGGWMFHGRPGAASGQGQLAGPRQEYIDAFDDGFFGADAGGAGSAAARAARAPGPRHPGGAALPGPPPRGRRQGPGPGWASDGSGRGFEQGDTYGQGLGHGYAAGRTQSATGRGGPQTSVPGRLLPDPGPAPLRGPRGRRPGTPGPWNAYQGSGTFARDARTDTGGFRRDELTDTGAGGLPRATPPPRVPGQAKAASGGGRSGSRGRAVTGVLAAAVTTVLAFVVAGQVTGGAQPGEGGDEATGAERGLSADGPASRSDKGRGTPADTPADAQGSALSYAQKMDKTFALDADLKGKGDFKAVSGTDEGAGGGEKMRYRVDVEKGLPLETDLFAQAVQKTLNDKRSWAHDGERSFERVSKGDVDFVITLASSPTTDEWCAKSGLDTSEQNVSCDSASTDRIMINAYRWAQGSKTFGDKRMLGYRQMLINHEVGHRIGRDHVGCPKDGALAPVMMQQTKSLESDGAKCRPNPWPHPRG